MDNQQQPKNNFEWFSNHPMVVHIAKTFSQIYPQPYTTPIINSQQALKGLSTEKQAFNYDYYFLKEKHHESNQSTT